MQQTSCMIGIYSALVSKSMECVYILYPSAPSQCLAFDFHLIFDMTDNQNACRIFSFEAMHGSIFFRKVFIEPCFYFLLWPRQSIYLLKGLSMRNRLITEKVPSWRGPGSDTLKLENRDTLISNRACTHKQWPRASKFLISRVKTNVEGTALHFFDFFPPDFFYGHLFPEIKNSSLKKFLDFFIT